MSQFSQRLIFGEGGVLLQDLKGNVIRKYSRRHFLEGSHYLVTNSLLGEISGNLLIEIDVPIAVEVTFVALIKAISLGAIAYANAPGSKAYADEAGTIARACAPGADACENARGAEAYACVQGSFVVLLS